MLDLGYSIRGPFSKVAVIVKAVIITRIIALGVISLIELLAVIAKLFPNNADLPTIIVEICLEVALSHAVAT